MVLHLKYPDMTNMSMSKNKKIIFVALSGGVDSSVTAALLQEQGFDVVGCHIKCFNIDGCGVKDAEDARRVAEQLNIPFYVFDLEQEYKDRVVKYMVDGYRQGLTPNPDVMCNKEIKFGLFLEKALSLGANQIATGHYVALKDGRLYQAEDKNKDQSYFLWTLTQDQLQHCLFPLGVYTKDQVRKMAQKYNLLTSEKKDSQGICFLGQVSLTDFLKDYIPAKKGLVLSTSGESVGQHDGAHFYTIGQRHGLNLGELSNTPHYVAEKDVESNTITVAEGSDHEDLFRDQIELIDIHFIKESPQQKEVLARLRYRQPLFKAQLEDNKLIFSEPQKFIAPGQSAVFYDAQGQMLGGGVIA